MGQITIHRIDADDNITSLDDGFRLQAQQAGVPDLPAEAMGVNLFVYLAGADTRSWYHWLLDRVRQSGKIRFPFRCDTPELHRDLEMVMRPLEQNGVEFECRPILEVPKRSRLCSIHASLAVIKRLPCVRGVSEFGV